ncbi:MAG: hypothetical protein WAL50_17915 [Kineosporiaceae bacterium]
MSGREVWVRQVDGQPVVGVFEPCDEGFRVVWDGMPAVIVTRPPASVTVVREGSLDFQALVHPDALRDRFRADGVDVVCDLLREAGKPLDEPDIRECLSGRLHVENKAVSAELPGALKALRAHPHIVFSPEYERPCYEWSNEPNTPDPQALLRRRPWRYLVKELPALKLTDDDREVLRSRLTVDPPDSFLQQLGLAAVGLFDWPEKGDVASRTARAGLGRELVTLPEPLLRAVRRRAKATGRFDILWMLVLFAGKSKALEGLGTELGEDESTAHAAAALEALRAELRATSRGEPAHSWPDVLERFPPLRDPQLVARALAAVQVTTEMSVQRALAQTMDPSELLRLPTSEFIRVLEDTDVAAAKAFCEATGLSELAARLAEAAPTVTDAQESLQRPPLDRALTPPTRAAESQAAPPPGSNTATMESPTPSTPPSSMPLSPTPRSLPDLKALLRRVSDRSGLAQALLMAVDSPELSGVDVARVVRRLAETDQAFAGGLKILENADRVEGLETELRQARACLASLEGDLQVLRGHLEAAVDREASLTESVKAQQQRADRLTETLRELHVEGQEASAAERRQWRIESLRAAVDLLNALDRAGNNGGEPAEFSAILARHGLTRLGIIGQVLPFDPIQHELSGDPARELVKVIHPGYSFRDGGTTTVLQRAVVTSRRE